MLLAECFAIDIAFGAEEGPAAVLFGQHLRLLLERDDRHDTSLVDPLLPRFDLMVRMVRKECYRPSVLCVVLPAHWPVAGLGTRVASLYEVHGRGIVLAHEMSWQTGTLKLFSASTVLRPSV